jgi:hypothetical protein
LATKHAGDLYQAKVDVELQTNTQGYVGQSGLTQMGKSHVKNPHKYIHLQSTKFTIETRCGMVGMGSLRQANISAAREHMNTLNSGLKPDQKFSLCTVCIGYRYPKYNPFDVVDAIALYDKNIVEGVKLDQFLKMTLGADE